MCIDLATNLTEYTDYFFPIHNRNYIDCILLRYGIMPRLPHHIELDSLPTHDVSVTIGLVRIKTSIGPLDLFVCNVSRDRTHDPFLTGRAGQSLAKPYAHFAQVPGMTATFSALIPQGCIHPPVHCVRRCKRNRSMPDGPRICHYARLNWNANCG